MTAQDAPAYDDTNIFAKILRGEMPCHRVFEDDVALAFLDVMPRGAGHTLVIPKRRARGLLDIAAADLAGFMPSVQKVAAGVVKAFESGGFVLQQFNEAVAGQQVFHLHFHIIPCFEGVPLRPHTGTMENSETLASQADRIRAALSGPLP